MNMFTNSEDKLNIQSPDDDLMEQKWTLLSTVGKQTRGVIEERNPLENPPEWFDLDRYLSAQKLARKHFLR